MSFIEVKKRNNVEYASFVKKFSLMGKSFRIRKHIGKNVSTLNEKEYLKNNYDSLTRREFDIRKKILDKLDIVYNTTLLSDVALKSIQINNLLEIKDIKEQILNEFAKEFIFNSNNIEGSRIPAEEVKKIIEKGDSKYENRNEVKEVFNSINAFNYLQNGFKFNIASIKRLYYILTNELTMSDGELYPRGFKKVENIVNNQQTVPPDQVEWVLEDLLNTYKENKRQEYPFKLAFDFHLRYEYIHPFLDGNGRTGRLIMNKILMEHGYFPIIVYTKNSQAYYNAISRGLEKQTKKSYYQFMFEQSKKTYKEFSTIIKEY
jgi:Fic family protein